MLANPHDAGCAPSRIPAWLQRTFIAGFLAIATAALILMWMAYWRRSAAIMGGDMVLLGLMRMLFDSEEMGIFSVRSRKFDVIFCITVGAIIIFLALTMTGYSG